MDEKIVSAGNAKAIEILALEFTILPDEPNDERQVREQSLAKCTKKEKRTPVELESFTRCLRVCEPLKPVEILKQYGVTIIRETGENEVSCSSILSEFAMASRYPVLESFNSDRGFGRIGGDSLVVKKDSDDPYCDFQQLMLQMILEKEIYTQQDLRELLNCFLQLNSPYHHGIIIRDPSFH